jgi:hypothetical protein
MRTGPELMFEVAELRAEIAKELAEGPSNDDDLTTTIRNSDQRSLITYESPGCMTSTLSGLLPPPPVKMVEPACLQGPGPGVLRYQCELISINLWSSAIRVLPSGAASLKRLWRLT